MVKTLEENPDTKNLIPLTTKRLRPITHKKLKIKEEGDVEIVISKGSKYKNVTVEKLMNISPNGLIIRVHTSTVEK